MSATNHDTLVDADGHIMEPADMWATYIDPAFREDCVRVVRDAQHGDKLWIRGAPSKRVKRLGGIAPVVGDVVNWDTLEGLGRYESYKDSCVPASYDPAARLRWMDERRIEATILFPSLGLIWPQEATGPGDYVRAHMQAYNRWIRDFSRTSPDRLLPVAQLALFDQQLAIADLEQLARDGFRHVMLPLVPAGTPPPFHEGYARFWAAVQAHDFVVHMHKVAIPHHLNVAPGRPLGAEGVGSFFTHVNEILPGQLCLAALMDARMPDRYPGIMFTILECNAGWVAPWLDRADESYEVVCGRPGPRLTAPPRHYIERGQVLFGLGSNENLDRLAGLEACLVVATDFPHPGCADDPLATWSERLQRLPAATAQAILRGNALRALERAAV
jgi:uncharacterized protein